MSSENESGGGRMDRGFHSDPKALRCYRVWAGEYAVLVDADSESQAKSLATNLLDVPRREITLVELLPTLGDTECELIAE